jgi:hypothetical protein
LQHHLIASNINHMAPQIAVTTAGSSVQTPQTIDSEFESDNDSKTTETPSILTSSNPRKRKALKQRHTAWIYARKAIEGVESTYDTAGSKPRRIWYCKEADCTQYSCLSTKAASHHLDKKHGISLEQRPSKVIKAIDGDLKNMFSQQELSNTDNTLRGAVDQATVHQTLLRLIVHHDLPLSTVEWPALHSFVFALNPMAAGCIWTTHQTTANHIATTFKKRQEQVKQLLQHSQSLIHLTTDTWHSPNFKELQAITAHFVDASNTRQKALLSLPELRNGHAGVEVATQIMTTLEAYGIIDKLGYITGDNHGANDTLCEALQEQLSTPWQAVQRRLRCVGHMINIAVQAFFFAKNKEAVDLAIEEAERSGISIDDELSQLYEKSDDNGGFIKVTPLQKILSFTSYLRRSDRQYNAFKRMAGKVIRSPNDTRWNSYLNTFEDAIQLKQHYTSFCNDNDKDEYHLTTAEWLLIQQTIAFLQPFKEATKRCEGDYVTLDKVQLIMDALSAHFKEQQSLHRGNTSFTESIITSWYAFDKYYLLIDQTGAYSAAILLHPSHRKSYLQTAWKKDWVSHGVDRARAIWQQYKNDDNTTNTVDTTTMTQIERYCHEIQQRQQRTKGASDEFERFIIAPAIKIDTPALHWWLQQQQRTSYPQLSKMAIDTLSAMAMSAESERVFSAARRTIPWTRARLEGAIIEQLECLKHWQRSGLISGNYVMATAGDSDSEQHPPEAPERQQYE